MRFQGFLGKDVGCSSPGGGAAGGGAEDALQSEPPAPVPLRGHAPLEGLAASTWVAGGDFSAQQHIRCLFCQNMKANHSDGSSSEDGREDPNLKTKRNRTEGLASPGPEEAEREDPGTKTPPPAQILLPLEERATHFRDMLLERGCCLKAPESRLGRRCASTGREKRSQQRVLTTRQLSSLDITVVTALSASRVRADCEDDLGGREPLIPRTGLELSLMQKHTWNHLPNAPPGPKPCPTLLLDNPGDDTASLAGLSREHRLLMSPALSPAHAFNCRDLQSRKQKTQPCIPGNGIRRVMT
ncbi:hypothetical protein CB1_000309021 [Camelus ferus]|nr:hypothetical protein CB1_000309021 [Camelus ferus]